MGNRRRKTEKPRGAEEKVEMTSPDQEGSCIYTQKASANGRNTEK